MAMPMVDVWKVRMRMCQRFMPMQMAMLGVGSSRSIVIVIVIVIVLMMLVVNMFMIVPQLFVDMLMLMTLSQM